MTPQDILTWLDSKSTNGMPVTSQQLTFLSTELQGKLNNLSIGSSTGANSPITLFYSGSLGKGDSAVIAWQVAEQIGKSSEGKVITIGQTELGKLLNAEIFKEYLRAAVGGNDTLSNNILNGYTDASSGKKIEGLWDMASQRLANAASGDVRTLSPFADPTKVFAQTELPALLANPDVKSINGIDKAVFEYIYDKTGSWVEVNKAVSASSSGLINDMTLVKSGDAVTKVDSISLFRGTGYEGISIPANEVNVTVKTTISQSLTAEAATNLGEGWKNLSMGAKGVVVLEGSAKLLGGLGIAATAYEIAQTTAAAQTAYNAGKQDEAAQILADGSVRIGAGWAGGAAASSFAAGFFAPLLPTGPVGDAAYLVLVLGSGIAGAVFSADTVKALLSTTGRSATTSVDGIWKITDFGNGVIIKDATAYDPSGRFEAGGIRVGSKMVGYAIEIDSPDGTGGVRRQFFGKEGTVTTTSDYHVINFETTQQVAPGFTDIQKDSNADGALDSHNLLTTAGDNYDLLSFSSRQDGEYLLSNLHDQSLLSENYWDNFSLDGTGWLLNGGLSFTAPTLDVKSRLVINALLEQFRFFGVPVFQGLNR